MKKLFQWIARNERHLSTAVFVGGFVFDNIVYTRVDLPWVTSFFVTFLIAAALTILVNFTLRREKPDVAPSYKRPFYTLVPLATQFFIGALLSGCFIFYLRSASLAASWPFLLLLAVVFVGNEAFRKYREQLVFQLSLFFFTLYAYAIFALPIARGKMDAIIFLESGLVSVVVFAAFLALLWVVGKKRLSESMRRITIAAVAILAVVNISYFTNILPPLPLALKDAGIYHALVKTGAGYAVQAETGDWNPLSRTVVHHVAGTPLYAYSAIFAPVRLTTPIVHRWQRYDESKGEWVTIASIAFPISGGRDGGYRGYSTLTSVSAGEWRVSIETEGGSVLGRERFTVETVTAQPVQHTEIK